MCVRVDTFVIYITITIRQFSTKRWASCARDLSFLIIFDTGIPLVVIIVREGKRFLARLCTLYTEWKNPTGSEHDDDDDFLLGSRWTVRRLQTTVTV